jgi:hypothetical protein
MLPRVVPVEITPDEIYQYLIPSERRIVSVRFHPAVMLPSVLLQVADVIALALEAAAVIPGDTAALVSLAILFPVSCCILYLSYLAWLRNYMVLTNNRIILLKGYRKRRLTFILITEAEDMSFIRTLSEQFFGYGSLIIRPAARRGHARRIGYVPYPEQMYLEICGQFPRNVNKPPMGPAAKAVLKAIAGNARKLRQQVSGRRRPLRPRQLPHARTAGPDTG